MTSASDLPVAQALRVKSGAVTLSVRVWERDDVPTVVLVHGYPDCQRLWVPVVAQLAGRYRVVTFDVRGAGESDAPTRLRDYRLDRLAADLRAVTDAVCPDQPFHLVAHDWGSIHSWESVTEPAMQSRIASFTSISGPCLGAALTPVPGRVDDGEVCLAGSEVVGS